MIRCFEEFGLEIVGNREFRLKLRKRYFFMIMILVIV